MKLTVSIWVKAVEALTIALAVGPFAARARQAPGVIAGAAVNSYTLDHNVHALISAISMQPSPRIIFLSDASSRQMEVA